MLVSTKTGVKFHLKVELTENELSTSRVSPECSNLDKDSKYH